MRTMRDVMQKVAKDRHLFQRHEDSSDYRMPTDARARAGGIESFSPYMRYHTGREAATRISNKALLADLSKLKARDANSAHSRALVSEARSRGLDVPDWALAEEKPTVPPSTAPLDLAAIGGSLVTGALAEKTLRGKEEILPAHVEYARKAAELAEGLPEEARAPHRRNYEAALAGLSEDQKAARAIVKELKDLGVRTDVGGGGARYEFAPHNRVVVGAKDHLSTLAHEAGHASGTWGKKALQAVYGPSKVYGLAAMPLVSLATYTAMGDTSFKGTPEERRERLSNAQKVVGVSALPYAPVLAEEARASARAVGMVNRLRGGGEAAKAALRLLPAFGTYTAAAAAPLTALYLLQRKKQKERAGTDEMRKAAEEQAPPATRDVARIAGAAVGGGTAQHFLPTKMAPFKRGAAVAAAIGTAGLVADKTHRALLEKQSTAWTPRRVHRLADTLGVPWDGDPHFMDFSEQVVGKRHLDDMSESELSVLAGALVRSCAASEKVAMAAFHAELEKIAESVEDLYERAMATRKKAMPIMRREQRRLRELGFRNVLPLGSISSGLNLPDEGVSDLDINVGVKDVKAASALYEAKTGVPFAEVKQNSWIHRHRTPEGFEVEVKFRPVHEVDYQRAGSRKMTAMPVAEKAKIVAEKHRLKQLGDKDAYRAYKWGVYEKYGILPPGGDWSLVKKPEVEKKASDTDPAAKKVPYSLLIEGNRDRFIKGYVRPRKKTGEHVPIKHDGKVVGFFTPREDPGGYWRTGAIYVQPEHRGKGLASKAIREFFKGKKGKAFIEHENAASRRAFTAGGFTQGDEETRWGGGHWFKKEASAPGLPDKKKTSPFPKISRSSKWELILQAHPAVRAGDHTDVRIVDPATGIAHSWATKKGWPGPGERVRLYQQPDHTADYARHFQGHLAAGYGRTKPGSKGVQKALHEAIEVLRADDKVVRFNLGTGEALQKFVLVRLKTREGEKPKSHPTWTLINVTKLAKSENTTNNPP